MLNYSYPFRKEPVSKLDFYSLGYCYPYFAQDWRLFTPCPNYNFNIYVSYKINGEQMYGAPLEETLKYKNLFNGGEFLKLAFTAAEGYLGYEASEAPLGVSYLPIGKNYFILQTITKNYLDHKHAAEITDLKIVILLKDIKTNNVKYLIDK